MIVATTIMGIAVVGLMAGLATTTHNAARLQDYDRAVQLARSRMNEIMLDRRIPRNITVSGEFDPSQSGGMESGWNVRIGMFEMPPVAIEGQSALDRVELEVWWNSGGKRRTFTLEAYRPHILQAEDMKPAGSK
jgi:hypothetical protein